ncbi:MAG: hypothetical protein KGL99_14180 [Burkholderiales bacterium]|nr:hypothetical protein [Burkholderiales bacterium]MDE2298165.1 hypothetical protein [Burkholderiales bacterium]MDE2628295.1 hypothetical protein [Burkholderiales bacterium]
MNEFAQAPGARLPLVVAADLQDHLLTVASDLERLQTLLDDSHHTLQAGFFGALQLLQELRDAGQLDAAPVVRVREHLGCAVKALQFQDMASQLIAHTSRRLHNCADRLARDAFADDEDGEAVVTEAPLRPNPVTQSEMDTGFIELF